MWASCVGVGYPKYLAIIFCLSRYNSQTELQAETGMGLRMGKMESIFQLWSYSTIVCNSRSWLRPKLKAQTSIWVFHLLDKNSSTRCLPGAQLQEIGLEAKLLNWIKYSNYLTSLWDVSILSRDLIYCNACSSFPIHILNGSS